MRWCIREDTLCGSAYGSSEYADLSSLLAYVMPVHRVGGRGALWDAPD
jgi:hypothetical protein